MIRIITAAAVAVIAMAMALPALVPTGPRLEFASSYTWSADAATGLSGLEVSRDGQYFIAVSDRGHRLEGEFLREGDRIVGVEQATVRPIRKINGQPATGYAMDAEGLACPAPSPAAKCDISFEMIHRVAQFTTPDAAARNRARPDLFRKMQHNSGLEALAVDDRGRLLAIPERSGDLERPFPIYRLEGGQWTSPFALRREPPFLVVGADFGPEGRLYVLERHFAGIGFQTRVRRLTLEGDRITGEETLLRTHLLRHDNLEGIGVWRDDDGLIRVTMVSDDNQNAFQRTEFVEYRLADPLG